MMTKNEKGSDEKPAAAGVSLPSPGPDTAAEKPIARRTVKKRRTPRRKTPAKSAVPKGRARIKARRARGASSGVRRRRVVPANARHPVPAVKVQRRRRTEGGEGVFDALFRFAAALGYRLELRALRSERRIVDRS